MNCQAQQTLFKVFIKSFIFKITQSESYFNYDSLLKSVGFGIVYLIVFSCDTSKKKRIELVW